MDNLRLEAVYHLATLAVDCLMPGQEFRGAFQWADQFGLEGIERKVFCTLFISLLHEKGRFVCDKNYIIKTVRA